MKGKYIGIIAAALLLILGAAYFSANISKNKAEQNSSSTASKAEIQTQNDRQQQISVNPIETYGDTDDERNYGYDVLYKHDGVTVMLIGSYFEGDSKDLRLSITNDTDKELRIITEYVAVNCYATDSFLFKHVDPHQTAEESIENIAELLESNVKITDVELKFSLVFDDYYVDAVYSDQIKIIYDYKEYPNLPIDGSELLWEAGGFELYHTWDEIISHDDGNELRPHFMYRNTGMTDYYLQFYFRCYIGDELVSESQSSNIEMPGGCRINYSFAFYTEPPYDVTKIERMTVTAEVYSLDGEYELLYSTDEIEFEIELEE